MSVAYQTQSNWSHIRGFGCSLSVDVSMALVPWGEIDVDAYTVERIVRAAITSGLIKDNDEPIDINHPEKWFRVEVQGTAPWVRFFSSQIGKPSKAIPLGKVVTKNEALFLPPGCNAVKLEYSHGVYSHFIEAVAKSGQAEIKYNPDPSIKLGELISVRYWKIERA
jgi:hypothetical protein